jgi:hypothetical protein
MAKTTVTITAAAPMSTDVTAPVTPSDEFTRFQDLARKIAAVPKSEIDEQEAKASKR